MSQTAIGEILGVGRERTVARVLYEEGLIETAPKKALEAGTGADGAGTSRETGADGACTSRETGGPAASHVDGTADDLAQTSCVAGDTSRSAGSGRITGMALRPLHVALADRVIVDLGHGRWAEGVAVGPGRREIRVLVDGELEARPFPAADVRQAPHQRADLGLDDG